MLQVKSLYPKGEDHILMRGELAREFGPLHNFVIDTDAVATLDDGRVVSHFLARKAATDAV